ncbi:unnamed protein product [Heligmosomoides polygyrus]|uniref:Uncharacterized protein n=1 Tax=Heligmosomoides polygyrus TaxID=6339 RepID=A0A183FUI9_HELPZ|nr:unnamed protein product [Heligmosomoides polygyrus]
MRYQNNHNNMMALKRHEKRAEFERRSVDDDFSNCFLSPVQCMLPSARRLRVKKPVTIASCLLVYDDLFT